MEINDYKEIFLVEAREYLQLLNESLLKLEAEPGNIELVQDMFRSAHSLKGMSATMSYDSLTKLTHELESILHLLREGSEALTSELADILFHALDLLENLLARVENPQLPEITIESLIEKLNSLQTCDMGEKAALSDDSQTVELDEFETEIVKDALERGENICFITITLHENTLLKSVRAYMAIKVLDEKGTMLRVEPPVSELEAENFEQSFSILYQCGIASQEVRKSLENISEVESVQIKDLSLLQLGARFTAELPIEIKQPQAKANGENKNGTSQTPSPGKEKTVRVDISKLDKLINMVGELVINRAQLVELGKASANNDIANVAEQLERITSELQSAVMKLRMIPIKQVFDRFPRMVRDLSRENGKHIHLEIIGEDTELDRSIVNQIGEPLVHLLRNAIDHGIDSAEERVQAGKDPEGTIVLEARYEGSYIAIEVRDDGRGLDAAKLVSTALKKRIITKEEAKRLKDEDAYHLIFKNGFSTAEKVTDISGRGVGMDAVKNMLEHLNGLIEIQSIVGVGTSITLRIPLTLAIIKALLVTAGDETYAIPVEFIRENLLITVDDINHLHNEQVIYLRKDIIPLVSLQASLMGNENIDYSGYIPIVIVKAGDKQCGLIVDDLLGQQDVVIKSFGSLLGQLKGIAGATVLGNGKVALILNIDTLI